MVEFKQITTPLTIEQERDFMWEQCKKLYKTISSNGQITAQAFRLSTQMAGGMFKGQIDMNPIVPWFSAMADFLEWVETALKQKGDTIC